MIMRTCVAVVLMWLAADVGFAQQRPPDDPGDLGPGEIQRLFDAYAVVQAQEMLKLPDPQYAQFITRLKAQQQTRRRNLQARNQILRSLAQLTRSDAADEAAVRDELKALADLDARAAGELRQAYASIDQLLDVRQQARFRVFEEQMERRKFEFLMRARQNRGRPARPNRKPS